MTALITILISLLGYGSPADYTDYSESELQYEINLLQENEADGGAADLEFS